MRTTQNSKEFALRAFVKEFAKQIDTGQIDPDADVTCISANSIPNKLRDKLEKTDRIIIVPDGKKLSDSLKIKIRKRKCIANAIAKAKVYVLNGLKQNLL